MNSRPQARSWIALSLVALLVLLLNSELRRVHAAVTREEVERAIREGVRYLKDQQRDGSWPDAHNDARSGTTSLVTLALLTAGEKPSRPP